MKTQINVKYYDIFFFRKNIKDVRRCAIYFRKTITNPTIRLYLQTVNLTIQIRNT